MQSVSVIGLGVMGAALARVLIDRGHAVTVWNRTPGKAEPLVAAGARLAESPGAAVRASDATITCVRSHSDTRALLEADPAALAGRTLIELSTGGAGEAAALADWVRAQGAACLIGMIAVFPKDIGAADSAIVVVGPEAAWRRCAPALKALAGKSVRIGEDPKALAAIYASLVLPRQGFMFGMIYGALLCEKAGVAMQDYVDLLPLTMRIVQDYRDVFAASVPGGNFADPPASMATYHAAFRDVLGTCRELGTADELPRLLHDLAGAGVAAGLGAEQITALVKLLRRAQ